MSRTTYTAAASGTESGVRWLVVRVDIPETRWADDDIVPARTIHSGYVELPAGHPAEMRGPDDNGPHETTPRYGDIFHAAIPDTSHGCSYRRMYYPCDGCPETDRTWIGFDTNHSGCNEGCQSEPAVAREVVRWARRVAGLDAEVP